MSAGMVYRYFVSADLRIMRDRERGVGDELVAALADARAASAAGDSPPDGSPEDLFDRAAQACEVLLAEIERTETSR
jgi:hypothetical protein